MNEKNCVPSLASVISLVCAVFVPVSVVKNQPASVLGKPVQRRENERSLAFVWAVVRRPVLEAAIWWKKEDEAFHFGVRFFFFFFSFIVVLHKLAKIAAPTTPSTHRTLSHLPPTALLRAKLLFLT